MVASANDGGGLSTPDGAGQIWPQSNFRVMIAGVELGCCEVRGLGSETLIAAGADTSAGVGSGLGGSAPADGSTNAANGPFFGAGPATGEAVDELLEVVGADRTAAVSWVLTPVALRRAIDGNRELFTWRANITAGNDDVRDVQVELLDGAGGLPVQAWRLARAWPLSWTAREFDALSSRPVCEQVQLIYASLQWLDNPQTEGM